MLCWKISLFWSVYLKLIGRIPQKKEDCSQPHGQSSIDRVIFVHSVKTSVRDRGLCVTTVPVGHYTWNVKLAYGRSAMLEDMFQRLVQHPTMDVEAFLMKPLKNMTVLLQLHCSAIQSRLLIPCFKRLPVSIRVVLWRRSCGVCLKNVLCKAKNMPWYCTSCCLGWRVVTWNRSVQWRSADSYSPEVSNLSPKDGVERLQLSPLRTDNANPVQAK